MTKIALLDDYQNVALELADWQSLNGRAEIKTFSHHIGDIDELADKLADFEIVCPLRERTAFPRELIVRLPNLKLLATCGMWNAAIDMKAARDHNVLVCGTSGTPTSTTELTWGLILAITRSIPQEDKAIRDGNWQTSLGIDLAGRTLGLLGLGRIGGAVARIGTAFRMNLIAWSENLTDERAEKFGAKRVTKQELFAQSDILSVHLVLSQRTKGLVGAEDLARMKPTAYLVNTSRGPIIDEQALVNVLQDNKIAGAGLDVFDSEPLSDGHPFLGCDNLVLTPHIGYVTEENYRIFYGDTLENIKAFLDGKPIRVIE